MFKQIINIIETLKCKKGFGQFRSWNRKEFKIFHSNLYENRDAKNYIEQIRDGVIETMTLFVGYPNMEYIDKIFNHSETRLFTFFHNRIDEKGRKFEGITLSFLLEVSANRFDKLDLIFEDIAVANIFDNEVNQVRLYISPLERYAENDYDLLYWDASDRRSLEVFQTAYADSIYFYKKDKKRAWTFWKNKYLDQFQKRDTILNSTSFL